MSVLKKIELNDGRTRLTAVVLAVSAAVFLICAISFHTKGVVSERTGDYSEYERAEIMEILEDTSERDPAADNAFRGQQFLTAEIRTGQYAGKLIQATNYIGPLYGVRLKAGDSAVLVISTYESGEVTASVFEYNRFYPLIAVLMIFILVTVLVGRGTGAKSLVALAITVASVIFILLPALLRGAPTILTTLLVSIYITVVSLAIIGGITKKTVCAMIGTVAGTTLAALFGLFAQMILRIDGLRISDIEPLLQINQSGEGAIGLRGLLVAGVIISAIGAVMDVAMSISSALYEIREANKAYGYRELFKSGMNIGRDMVGTMTNTLIMAFLGSSLTFIVYLYSLDLEFWQLMSSAYLSLEIISGIGCSIGLVLAIPLTALVSSYMYVRDK